MPGGPFHISQAHTHIGEEIAVSDWTTLDQRQVDLFAESTRDPDWMHSDVERSRRESPYGTTIVQGFLMMSLVIHLTHESDLVPGGDRVRPQLRHGPGAIYLGRAGRIPRARPHPIGRRHPPRRGALPDEDQPHSGGRRRGENPPWWPTGGCCGSLRWKWPNRTQTGLGL